MVFGGTFDNMDTFVVSDWYCRLYMTVVKISIFDFVDKSQFYACRIMFAFK